MNEYILCIRNALSFTTQVKNGPQAFCSDTKSIPHTLYLCLSFSDLRGEVMATESDQ